MNDEIKKKYANIMYPKSDFEKFKNEFIKQGLNPKATYLDWLKWEYNFSKVTNPDKDEKELLEILSYKIEEIESKSVGEYCRKHNIKKTTPAQYRSILFYLSQKEARKQKRNENV